MRPGEEIVRRLRPDDALSARARARRVTVRQLQLIALSHALGRCAPAASVAVADEALVVRLGSAAERFDKEQADRVIAAMEAELTAAARA